MTLTPTQPRLVHIFVLDGAGEPHRFQVDLALGLSGDPLPGLGELRDSFIDTGEPVGARCSEADLNELLDAWSGICNRQVEFTYEPATDRDGWIIRAYRRQS